jgi:hypothetical protein
VELNENQILFFRKLDNLCIANDCENAGYSKGYCRKHHQQVELYGQVHEKIERHCNIKGCHNKFFAKDRCQKHYHQLYRKNNAKKLTNDL